MYKGDNPHLGGYESDDSCDSSFDYADFLKGEQVVAEAVFRGLALSLDSISVEEAVVLLKQDESREKKTIKHGRRMDAFKMSGGIPCINIAVRGVPMFAYIADHCRYTIVSRSVAEQLRISRDDYLTSTEKFVRASDGNQVAGFKFTLLEPFWIQLDDVDVCIRNAIEIDPDPAPFYGIRLGKDFFKSAMVCSIDLQMELHGEQELRRMWRRREDTFVPAEQTTKEALRYYKWDGTYAILNVLRFQPWSEAQSDDFTVPLHTPIWFCDWCEREFPERMKFCDTCGVCSSYCSRQCQVAAWPVHKRRCGKYSPYVPKSDEDVASVGDENIDRK